MKYITELLSLLEITEHTKSCTELCPGFGCPADEVLSICFKSAWPLGEWKSTTSINANELMDGPLKGPLLLFW